MATEKKAPNNTMTFEQRCELLRMPIPPEALNPIGPKPNDTNKKWFTDINDAYVMNLLNDAFGNGGWTFREVSNDVRFHEADVFSVTVTAELYFPEYGIIKGPMSCTKYGTIKKVAGEYVKGSKKIEDMHKGCNTAVFGQLYKMMGVGAEVFAGLYSNYTKSYEGQMPAPLCLEDGIKALENSETVSSYNEAWSRFSGLYASDDGFVHAAEACAKRVTKSKSADQDPQRVTLQSAVDTLNKVTTRAEFEEAMKAGKEFLATPAFSKKCKELSVKFPKPSK